MISTNCEFSCISKQRRMNVEIPPLPVIRLHVYSLFRLTRIKSFQPTTSFKNLVWGFKGHFKSSFNSHFDSNEASLGMCNSVYSDEHYFNVRGKCILMKMCHGLANLLMKWVPDIMNPTSDEGEWWSMDLRRRAQVLRTVYPWDFNTMNICILTFLTVQCMHMGQTGVFTDIILFNPRKCSIDLYSPQTAQITKNIKRLVWTLNLRYMRAIFTYSLREMSFWPYFRHYWLHHKVWRNCR